MITLIGDVHGKHLSYFQITKQHEFTVQIGDFGFNYEILNSVPPTNHKIIGGNHDNYELLPYVPHNLGDFGSTKLNSIEFFYIRGEYSVDLYLRTLGISWWPEEELNYASGTKMLELYEQTKPKIVLSHGCPEEVIPLVVTNNLKLRPSKTARLLQAAFDVHKPELWVFGHHHNSKDVPVKGTRFICLDELETLTI